MYMALIVLYMPPMHVNRTNIIAKWRLSFVSPKWIPNWTLETPRNFYKNVGRNNNNNHQPLVLQKVQISCRHMHVIK